jgi:hypothetical protein
MLISFWHADTITSSDSSGLNDPTNLLNSTAYKEKTITITTSPCYKKNKDSEELIFIAFLFLRIHYD